MRNKKKIIVMLMILIVIGACGCRMEKEHKKHNSEVNIITEMKKHLWSKYGDIEYEIEGFISAGWDHSYDCLNCSVVLDGVKESFSVERHNNEGEYYFQDSYFGLVVKDEFEKEVSKYASKYFENFKIYAGLTYDNYPNELNAESSFQDLLEMKSEIFDITFFILVKEYGVSIEEFHNDAKLFITDWSNVGLSSTPRVIYLDADVYEGINAAEYNKLYDENKIITEYRESVN